jgi:predicted DCC family thiol-disulfide oxidoreductase YuxK
MARWVRRRDRTGRVLVIASQTRGVRARYSLTREELDRAAWTIDRSGGRLEGAAAVNRILKEARGAWPALASIYGVRPLAALEELVYRWFARNRSSFHRFGVQPECEEPGSGCE